MKIEKEKILEKKLSMEIEKLGGWSLKLLSTHVTGLPDRMCLLPGGRVFFAEVKTTKEKPKRIQIWVHNKIRALGFRVEIIDQSEKIKELIRDYG
jgi:hypothetical protein